MEFPASAGGEGYDQRVPPALRLLISHVCPSMHACRHLVMDSPPRGRGDGAFPTPPTTPEAAAPVAWAPGDEVDTELLRGAGIVRSDGTLDAGIITHTLALLCVHDGILEAMRRRREALGPDLGGVMAAAGLFAETFSSARRPDPPLSTGALGRVLDLATGSQHRRPPTLVLQVVSAGIAEDKEGMYRRPIRLSDGASTVSAYVDASIWAGLFGPGSPVGDVWQIGELTRYRLLENDILVLLEASRLMGHQGAPVLNQGNLVPATPASGPAIRGAAAPYVAGPVTAHPANGPGEPPAPAVSCNGDLCQFAISKSGTGRFTRRQCYPLVHRRPGCQAAHLPEVALIYEDYVDRNSPAPDLYQYPTDPGLARPKTRRHCLYRHVAFNWYECRGAGMRIMIPPCIWARVRCMNPNPFGEPYGEEIPPIADFREAVREMEEVRSECCNGSCN